MKIIKKVQTKSLKKNQKIFKIQNNSQKKQQKKHENLTNLKKGEKNEEKSINTPTPPKKIKSCVRRSGIKKIYIFFRFAEIKNMLFS